MKRIISNYAGSLIDLMPAFALLLVVGVTVNGCSYLQTALDIPTPTTAKQTLATVRVEFANAQDLVHTYTAKAICIPPAITGCADPKVVVALADAEAKARLAINDAELLITSATDDSLTSAGAEAAREALAALQAALLKNGVK